MTFSTQVWTRVAALVNGVAENYPGNDRPVSVSIPNDEVYRKIITISNNANATIYADQLSTFMFMLVACDFNTRMLVTDTNSASMSFTLRGTATANQYGVPFMLGDDLTTSGFRVNAVQLFNTSGSTAHCICLVFD